MLAFFYGLVIVNDVMMDVAIAICRIAPSLVGYRLRWLDSVAVGGIVLLSRGHRRCQGDSVVIVGGTALLLVGYCCHQWDGIVINGILRRPRQQ